MEPYFLMGKDGKVQFQIPESWTVLKNAFLTPTKTDKSIYDMVGDALKTPVGTASLKDLITPNHKIAIVVDDFARPTPKKEILAALFDYLKECGVTYDQLDIIFALGTHRGLTDEEVDRALGDKLKGKVRWANHNAWADDLVPIGRLKLAGEVKINPLVAGADFRITVGSILAHPMNGFGGGAKSIFPGVSNFDAIRDHHIALMIAKDASFGNTTGNPFREEVCEAAGLARLDFIINAIYNAEEEVKGIVAGDFMKAHETGAEMSRKEYALPFDEMADVTITSTFPYTEGPQLMKPVGPAVMVTKEGGNVIHYASRIEGGRFPEPLLKAFDTAYAMAQGDPKALVLQYLREGKLIVPDAPMDFNCALDTTLLNLSRVKATLVAKDADESQASRLGFQYAPTLEEAIAMVAREHPEAKVNILPSGGLTIPIVKEPLVFE